MSLLLLFHRPEKVTWPHLTFNLGKKVSPYMCPKRERKGRFGNAPDGFQAASGLEGDNERNSLLSTSSWSSAGGRWGGQMHSQWQSRGLSAREEVFLGLRRDVGPASRGQVPWGSLIIGKGNAFL